MIVKNLKRDGIFIKKDFEKKRMIMEVEVTKNFYQTMKIESVLQTILKYESSMEQEQVNQKTA